MIYFAQLESGAIKGFPAYRLARDGVLWSCLNRHGKQTGCWHRISLTPEKNGYIRVTLRQGTEGPPRRELLHRLILETFVGPCPMGMEACHENGIRSDNRVENLRWDTRKANRGDMRLHGTLPRGESHGMSRHTDEDIRSVRRLHSEGRSHRKIAAITGIGRVTVGKIIRGQAWRHIA